MTSIPPDSDFKNLLQQFILNKSWRNRLYWTHGIGLLSSYWVSQGKPKFLWPKSDTWKKKKDRKETGDNNFLYETWWTIRGSSLASVLPLAWKHKPPGHVVGWSVFWCVKQITLFLSIFSPWCFLSAHTLSWHILYYFNAFSNFNLCGHYCTFSPFYCKEICTVQQTLSAPYVGTVHTCRYNHKALF